jgi:glycosyltransferase involved in cell wall biosynthesis
VYTFGVQTGSDLSAVCPTLPESNGLSAPARKVKVLILCSHVVPYASAMFVCLANDPRFDISVAYCSMQGAEAGYDPEFGVKVQWDEPLLEGYRWVYVANRSLRPRLAHFFGLWNPGLWKLIREGGFDAIVIYTGYMCASFWLAVAAGKSKHVPVIISSDSTSTQPRDKARWKARIKPFVLGRVYRAVDVLMAASPAVEELAVRLGMPKERIAFIPSGMNKDAWIARVAKFDRNAVREGLNIPADAPLVLYCAKLQAWKKPLDLLGAFAKAAVPNAYLVYAGDGPVRQELEQETRALGLMDRVRILGFVNSSQLPGLYKAADVFVLPSEYDPCPLVVPEAMLAGVPTILSDAVVGRISMIDPGNSGYTYPCGDSDRLATILRKVLCDSALLQHLKEGVTRQMEMWRSSDFLDSWLRAIDQAKRQVSRTLAKQP